MTSTRILMVAGGLICSFGLAEAAKVPMAFLTLEGHTKPVWCVDISPDGKTVASGSTDGAVRLWDITTGKQKHLFKVNPNRARNVAFSRDGKMLIASS